MHPQPHRPMVISPNYKFLIKTKNEPSLENPNPNPERQVKPKKLRILNEFKKKEENWNQRFVIANIPEYNFFQDKHCEGYSQYLIKKHKKVRVEFAPGKIRKKPSDISNENTTPQSKPIRFRPESVDNRASKPPTAENQLIRRVNKQIQIKKKVNLELQGEALRTMRDELSKLWEKSNVPEHHKEIFEICCKSASLQRLHEIFSKEIEELNNKKSPVLACIKAVKAREGCLSQLRQVEKLFKSFNPDDPDDDLLNSGENPEELLNRSSELLTHLRILSLNVVECISKWKDNFSYLFLLSNNAAIKKGALFLPYIFNNENYLLKMVRDLDFLGYSHLGAYFNFSNKSDPFLTNLTHDDPATPGKLIQYVSKTLINRIRICESVLYDEVLNDKINKGKYLPGQALDLKFPMSGDHDNLFSHIRGNAGNIYTNKLPVSNKANVQRDPFSQNDQDSEGKNRSFNRETLTPKQPPKSFKAENFSASPKDGKSPSPGKETNSIKTEAKPPQTIIQKDSEKPEEKPEILLLSPSESLFEDELESFLLNYLSSVPQNLKDTFFSDVPEIIKRSRTEDLNLLRLTNADGVLQGLAILHTDKNYLLLKRMSLLHFSMKTSDTEELSKGLSLLLQYVWAKDNSEEIRVNMYHSKNQGTNEFELEKPLQEVFTKKGFRWKLLTNDKDSDTRFTTFALRRNNEEFPAPALQSEPIILRSGVLISQSEYSSPQKDVKISVYDNSNCQLNALQAFGIIEDEDLSDNLKTTLINIRNSPNFVMPGMKCQEFDENPAEKLKKFLEDNKFSELEHAVQAVGDQRSVCSLLKICHRWENFRTAEANSLRFLRIIPSLENSDLYFVGKIKGKQTPMFIIPTDDEKVKIFIYSADEDLLEKSEDNQIFSEINKAIVKGIHETRGLDKEVWVPSFSKKVGVRKVEEINAEAKNCSALECFEFSIDYSNKLGGLLKTRKSEEEYYLIEPPFVFGLLHTDLEERIETTYAAALITIEDCIKVEELID